MAGAVSLEGVIGTWLAYPYVGIGAFNRMRPWRHCPKTVAVISRTDHLTTVRNAERVHDMVRNCGADVETWIADGSHSFDEPMTALPMIVSGPRSLIRMSKSLCQPWPMNDSRRFCAL